MDHRHYSFEFKRVKYSYKSFFLFNIWTHTKRGWTIIREPGVLLYTFLYDVYRIDFFSELVVGSIHSRYRPFSKKSASIQLERQSSISGLWTFHGIFFQAYFCFSCAKKADKTNCIYYLSTLKNNFFCLPFILLKYLIQV